MSDPAPSPATTSIIPESERRAFERDLKKCERWKGEALTKQLTNIRQKGPMVKFMMDHLERVGCPMTKDHFRCTPCDMTRAGGFAPEFGIVLCQNRFKGKQHMEDLIHAFDHCTTKINWNNCEQYACSEIRAANLSGECKFTREISRGFFGFAKHHQACVRRRAIFALQQIPPCSRKGVAEDAVRLVWDSCFNDTAPFDEIA
ncbi:peptidase M76 family-domain-containing protein [Chytridium lagenaria]|nr:peptidase M76 family-domain-containing protein [Chytridium lagenaria]